VVCNYDPPGNVKDSYKANIGKDNSALARSPGEKLDPKFEKDGKASAMGFQKDKTGKIVFFSGL